MNEHQVRKQQPGQGPASAPDKTRESVGALWKKNEQTRDGLPLRRHKRCSHRGVPRHGQARAAIPGLLDFPFGSSAGGR